MCSKAAQNCHFLAAGWHLGHIAVRRCVLACCQRSDDVITISTTACWFTKSLVQVFKYPGSPSFFSSSSFCSECRAAAARRPVYLGQDIALGTIQHHMAASRFYPESDKVKNRNMSPVTCQKWTEFGRITKT